MFYSQIILAKKGPLAKVWMAAHWGDRKLGRPQIFATDITETIDNIQHPQVPLALRVSGHLLLGVVRIYSRKVQYVLHDCTEAMVQIKMAFTTTTTTTNATTGDGNDVTVINLPAVLPTGNAVWQNFGRFRGEEDPVLQSTNIRNDVSPFDLNDTVAEKDWMPAELNDDDDEEDDDPLREHDDDDDEPDLYDDEDVRTKTSSSRRTTPPRQEQEEDEWTEWDVDGDAAAPKDESHVSEIEITRAADHVEEESVRRKTAVDGRSRHCPIIVY